MAFGSRHAGNRLLYQYLPRDVGRLNNLIDFGAEAFVKHTMAVTMLLFGRTAPW